MRGLNFYVVVFSLITMAIGFCPNAFATDPNYDDSLVGPVGRSSLPEQKTKFDWIRAPGFIVKSGAATSDIIYNARDLAISEAISKDRGFQEWSARNSITLADFSFLEFRAVDLSKAKTRASSTRFGRFLVHIPFAGDIRYVKIKNLQEGTLYIYGEVQILVGENGSVETRVLTYNDSSATERAGRALKILNNFDFNFAKGVVLPLMNKIFVDPAIVKQWLVESGAVEKIEAQKKQYNLR